MLFIHGIGHFHPENRIDNRFLESLGIGTTDEWIRERVGIESRRTVLSLDYLRETKNKNPTGNHRFASYTNAETAAKAAQMALSRAGITASQVGLVIAGGCTPQYTTPAEACTIAAQLGIQCPAFDLNSACSSFAVQLHSLGMMREEALPEYVLVVNVENNTRWIDYEDKSSAVLWGDASTAAVISARHASRWKIRHTVFGSDPAEWGKVSIPPGEHFRQDGGAVHGFAIKRSVAVLSELRAHVTGAPGSLYYVGHQANLRMLQAVCARAEIPPERHLFNIDKFGNCGAAGAPSVLSQNWDRLTDGDEVAVAVVGAGLSWGGLLLQVGPV